MSKLKRIILTIAASLGLLAPAAMPATVFAADPADPETTAPSIQDGLCQGAELMVGADCTDVTEANAAKGVNDIITTVINIFSIVVGVIAVIMIIVGGLKYITSGGDSGNITGAKNTILYAIVGLVVVALAQIIVRFVLTETGDLGAPEDPGI